MCVYIYIYRNPHRPQGGHLAHGIVEEAGIFAGQHQAAGAAVHETCRQWRRQFLLGEQLLVAFHSGY